MEDLEFTGSFDPEKTQLTDIGDKVTGYVGEIKSTLNEMNSYWQDEKSATFISGAESDCEEIITLVNKAVSDGCAGLDEVAKSIHIF